MTPAQRALGAQLHRNSARERSKRGLCAVVGCETPPLPRDGAGIAHCVPHFLAGVAQNQPTKARAG